MAVYKNRDVKNRWNEEEGSAGGYCGTSKEGGEIGR